MAGFELEQPGTGSGEPAPAEDQYRVLEVVATNPFADAETGDDQARILIPALYNGWTISAVMAGVSTTGTGTTTVQIARRRSGANTDVLSTRLTIDTAEETTATAATPAVIGAASGLATGDWLMFDVDTVGTGVRGIYVAVTITDA